MSRMNGGEALIKSLRRNGVDVVFGLPGAGQYEAIDAIYQEEGINYITTRNEQAISYLADGYARVSGKPGVGLAVQGPGFYNTTAGLATAYAQSSPVLLITGNHHRVSVPNKTEYNSLDSYKAYSKWAGQAKTPGDIPKLVNEAFRQLNTPRKRPVILEIAPTVFSAVDEVQLLEPETITARSGDSQQLEQAAILLSKAERPLIWVGAGAGESGSSIQKLAEHLGSPVVSSRSGKGVLSDQHSLSLGSFEPRFKPLADRIDDCDVILAVGIGADLKERSTSQKIIRIDDDPNVIDLEGDDSLGILGDSKLSLEIILDHVIKTTRSLKTTDEDIQAINNYRFGPSEQLEPQCTLMNGIRAAIPENSILVAGMNQMGYYSRNYYHCYSPRGYQTSSHHGTLGSVFPIGLGLKLAQPDRPVIVVSGDGGFLYNAQEMATAVKYSINTVIIVFNDNAYGNVQRAQVEEFGGHVIGTNLHNPDFVQMAESYGVKGIRVEDYTKLEAAIRDGINTQAPILIEVPVGPLERKY